MAFEGSYIWLLKYSRSWVLDLSIKVDPFGTGFGHKQGHAFVLNKFRLAFQVFLKPEGDQGPTIMVKDVAVSEIIADRKACGDLEIVACSDTSSPFVGKFLV